MAHRTYNARSSEFEGIEEMARLSFKHQPVATMFCVTSLTFCLPACGQQNNQSPEVTALVKKPLNDMVLVKGGGSMLRGIRPRTPSLSAQALRSDAASAAMRSVQ